MITQTVDQIIYVEATLVARAIAVGRRAHMRYQVLPRLGPIEGPIELPNGWTAIPRDMDDSCVPHLADEQVSNLKNSGIRIPQQIILHEPAVEREPGRIEQVIANIDTEKLKGQAKKAGTAAAAVATACAMGTLFLLGAAASLASIALIDPALVCVLEDGTWLVVCSWA